MKIDVSLDTDVIKSKITEKVKIMWEKSDPGHIFLGSLVVLLSTYMVIDKLPNIFKKDSCCVDVTLEKITPYPDTTKIPPKTKHAQLYNTGVSMHISPKEFDCLARNIYWETQHEPLLGQIAVANTTYNRVMSGKWGNTFCSVVNAPKQFSWTNFKKIRNARPKNEKQWERAKHSTMLFAKGVRVTNLDKTQFYYADYIKMPSWARKMTKTAKIGTHIFYAEK